MSSTGNSDTAAVAKPPLPQDINCKDSTLDVEYWAFRWQHEYTGWHEKSGNKLMWDYMNTEYIKTVKDAAVIKVFVPLCGKTQDMFMLYKLGFTVVGIEYAPKAIEEFFAENDITTQANPKFGSDEKAYTASEDGRMIIGQGDLFTFTPENLPHAEYDIIWDRGSLEALNLADREKYANLLLSMLKSDGVYLIDSKDYDVTQYGGPPLKANADDIQKLVGDRCSVQEVSRKDLLSPDNPSREKWMKKGITNYMFEILHLVKKL